MLPPHIFPPRLGRFMSSLRHLSFFGLKYTTSFFYPPLFWSSNTANPPVIWLQSQQVREGKSHPGVLQARCDQFHLLGDHQSSYGWDTASGAWKVQQFTLPYSWWRQVSVQTRAGTAGCLVHWKQSGSTWGQKNPTKPVNLWVVFTEQGWILYSSFECNADFSDLKHDWGGNYCLFTCSTFWVKHSAPTFIQEALYCQCLAPSLGTGDHQDLDVKCGKSI